MPQQMGFLTLSVKDVNHLKNCTELTLRNKTTRVFALDLWNFLSPLCIFASFEDLRWAGMDTGGLLQRACAAAAGLGDVCLPHHVLHLFRLPRSPHHWPGGPYQHRLELCGEFPAEPTSSVALTNNTCTKPAKT